MEYVESLIPQREVVDRRRCRCDFDRRLRGKLGTYRPGRAMALAKEAADQSATPAERERADEARRTR